MLVSILIPTRDGASTITGTIASALDQTSQNFEVVIFDDSKNETIKSIVKKFKSPKIKYYRSRKSGNSMCDNWDAVVKKSNGDIVFIIGDDDAVMPNAVEKIQETFIKFNPDVIYWRPHKFYWPGVFSASAIALKSGQSGQVSPMNLDSIVKHIFSLGGSHLNRLPMIYHSAVSRRVINEIISSTGRFFHSKQPDVFIGMACAAVANSAVHVDLALTVNAWSLRSNSGSMRKEYGSEKNLEYIHEFKNKKFHKSLPDDPRMAFFNATPDAILTAAEKFPSYFCKYSFNYSAMFAIFARLSAYKNYWWILKNRKIFREISNFSIGTFHLFLFLNFAVSVIGRVQRLFDLRHRVESDSPYLWIKNESNL
jgi:glycosyltransferase involved in cell wall biosynthesis